MKLIKKITVITLVVCSFAFTLLLGNFVMTFQSENRSKAADNEIAGYLFPKEVATKSGDVIKISPRLVSANGLPLPIAAVILSISFDKDKLFVSGFENPAAESNYLLLKTTPLVKANTDGQFKLFYGIKNKESTVDKAVNLPFIDFKLIASTGSASVTLQTQASQVVLVSGKQAIFKWGEQLPSVKINVATPTPVSPTPAPTSTLPTVFHSLETTLTPIPAKPTATPTPRGG